VLICATWLSHSHASGCRWQHQRFSDPLFRADLIVRQSTLPIVQIDQEFKPYSGVLKPFVDTTTISNRSFGKVVAKASRQPKTFDLKRRHVPLCSHTPVCLLMRSFVAASRWGRHRRRSRRSKQRRRRTYVWPIARVCGRQAMRRSLLSAHFACAVDD
jgi:hypothetical protein